MLSLAQCVARPASSEVPVLAACISTGNERPNDEPTVVRYRSVEDMQEKEQKPAQKKKKSAGIMAGNKEEIKEGRGTRQITTGMFVSGGSSDKRCLQMVDKPSEKSPMSLLWKECNAGDAYQHWKWKPIEAMSAMTIDDNHLSSWTTSVHYGNL